MTRRLLTAWLPALVVAACFLTAYHVRRPTSGLDVTAVVCCPTTPVEARVVIRRPGRRAVEAGTRTDADGRARLFLSPGRYEVRGRGPRLRARPLVVRVRDDAFESITVRFRRVARRAG